VLFFPHDTISLPLPTVDKKVRGLKSLFFAVVTWLDTEDLPDGGATSVNYGGRDNFKLICNAHNSCSPCVHSAASWNSQKKQMIRRGLRFYEITLSVMEDASSELRSQRPNA
jgi:hypothetical protein